MNVDPLAMMERAFGWQEFPDALFYNAPFALRFELGGDRDMGPLRLLQAIDRARAVAEALFSGSETLFAVVSIYGDERATRRQSATIQQLKGIGFPHPFGSPVKVPQHDQEYIADFGSDLFRYWYAAKFIRDEASVAALLWASIASEMDIHPKARWIATIHISDPQKQLALTAYDDRGMDVIGPDATSLSGIYGTFNPWLLDYDREKMDATFSS